MVCEFVVRLMRAVCLSHLVLILFLSYGSPNGVVDWVPVVLFFKLCSEYGYANPVCGFPR